jgi:porin
VLAIVEAQYSYPSLGAMVDPNAPEPLAGTYRLGMWFDSEHFADLRFDTAGRSLANPASNGVPRSHSGDYGIYAVVDQMIWRDPKDEDGDRAASFFTRAMGTPQTDRNLIDFSLNIGLTMHEPIPHRGDDTLGIGLGYARASPYASGLDEDTSVFSKSSFPVRGGETFIEATYQYELTPWCQIQPDFQYVFNPGAGVPNPDSPGNRIKNEAVFGLRVNITF